MRTARFRDYGDRYIIFENGDILGTAHDNILKPSIQNGNVYYSLSCKSVVSRLKASRIIYEAFNGEIKGMIDFKDGDSLNLSLDNLIDVPRTKRFNKSNCHAVRNKETDETYESIRELARHLGVTSSTLNKCMKLNGKYKKYEKI